MIPAFSFAIRHPQLVELSRAGCLAYSAPLHRTFSSLKHAFLTLRQTSSSSPGSSSAASDAPTHRQNRIFHMTIPHHSNSTASGTETSMRRCNGACNLRTIATIGVALLVGVLGDVVNGQKIAAVPASARPSAASGSLRDTTTPTLKDMVQAYIYGYPLLLMNQTLTYQLCTQNASINSIGHSYELSDASTDFIVRPNVDTLYSSAVLDLSKGPVVLTIPPTDGRYLLVALLDAWTNNFVGASTLDIVDIEEGSTFVVALEGWEGELPANSTLFDAPTPSVWLLIRTEVLGADDVPQANRIQDAMTVSPLKSNSISIPVEIQCTVESPPETVANLSGMDFFSKLAELVAEQGVLLPGDEAILETLAHVGIGPSATFAVEDLRPFKKAQLQIAVNVAQNIVSTVGRSTSSSISPTGWSPRPNDIPIGDYGDDYLVRALIAAVGFGANRAEFALYQNTNIDANNVTLSGEGSAVYYITFPAGEEPPVDGFWSVTVYGQEGYLIANDLDRYALGINSDLVVDNSGSIVLTLSQEPPVGCPEANWLPIPGTVFQLTLRLYGPTEAILTEEWTPPRPQLQEAGACM